MKKLLIIIALVLASCTAENDQGKNFTVYVYPSDNEISAASKIECDSVDMLSENHAICWINGTKVNVYGKQIKIFTK